ncbi:MAG: nicotinate-nucleotide adenylyltransferase [Chloroflexi bacterium]|nr:nicotinate-nucleotide adenylyltransferase [Chloroflexota bacterium]
MRCGILGGTFNPIHLGHLIIAEEAREQLGLDEVIFVPAARPWMKEAKELASAKDRLAMVRLAIKGNPRFTVSAVDIERPGPSYAVDSTSDIRKARGSSCELLFIMGMDSLNDLPKWHNSKQLLSLCRIAALARPGIPTKRALARLDRALPGARRRVDVIETTNIDISATDIRRRVASGRSIAYRVPGPVSAYIAKHRLYR